MRYVYPGAHHTRYEYIFTQLLLISNITITKGIEKRNVELSLGSTLNEFEDFNINATGGDIMQCLAILNNAGHMYDTFSSSKLLTRLLQESRENNTSFYTVYKRNLPKELQESFDVLLNDSNYYKLHQYHMIHILKGMLRNKENVDKCQFFIKLLTLLIDPNLIQTEAVKRIYFLYKKIRKIAYLSEDMIYTPASFGANLSRMIYSISTYVDDLFNDDSPMNQAIIQLEDIIHKQIYDSPLCILNSTRIEQCNYNKYKKIIDDVKSIYDVRQLILELNYPYNLLHWTEESELIKRILPKSTISFGNIYKKSKDFLCIDNKIIGEIPDSRIAFGTQISQNLKRIYAVFGLLDEDSICQDTQLVLRESINRELITDTEKKEVIKYAIKSLYLYNKFYFNLTSPLEYEKDQCVLIGKGCKALAKEIRENYNRVTNKNDLHEILSCAAVLDNINYKGQVVCYVGGIKASKYDMANKIDELDGFIYFPSRDMKNTFAIIVEAKNYSHGESDAEKQLKETIPFLNPKLRNKIILLSKCAYMELSLK